MSIKRMIMAVILVGLVAGISLARGTWNGYPNGQYGPYDHMGYLGNSWGGNGTVESYTGKFALEDEQYAVLETSDGQRYYLLPGAPIVGNPPQDGDELAIEAFPSQRTPNTLVVISAMVNGLSITPENKDYGEYHFDDRNGPGGWGSPGRPGGPGGMGGYGGGTGGYGGPGGYGGRRGSRGGYHCRIDGYQRGYNYGYRGGYNNRRDGRYEQ